MINQDIKFYLAKATEAMYNDWEDSLVVADLYLEDENVSAEDKVLGRLDLERIEEAYGTFKSLIKKGDLTRAANLYKLYFSDNLEGRVH